MGGSERNITSNIRPDKSGKIISKRNKHFTVMNTFPVAHPNTGTSQKTNVIMKADSGASKHFIKQENINILSNVQNTSNTAVILSNRKTLNTNLVGA